MNENFLDKLLSSIISSDLYILFFFFLALIFLIISWTLTKVVENNLHDHQPVSEKTYYWFGASYTLFVTFISLFPLLGMFGTVKALLELDLSGDLESIKLKFFNALTSTAWGIIFSVLFKFLHALIQFKAEDKLAKAQTSIEQNSVKKKFRKEGDQHETQRNHS